MAGELGILKKPGFGWDSFVGEDSSLQLGTEHAVDLSITSGLVGKTTIPPAFGLVPAVISLPVVNLRAAPGETTTREVIEFLHATPLEYLARWIANNDVFGDDVKLASVIAWPDARVSFGITQPQYHGQPAEPRDIEKHFMDGGHLRNQQAVVVNERRLPR